MVISADNGSESANGEYICGFVFGMQFFKNRSPDLQNRASFVYKRLDFNPTKSFQHNHLFDGRETSGFQTVKVHTAGNMPAISVKPVPINIPISGFPRII